MASDARLILIEARKVVDTRAGRMLLGFLVATSLFFLAVSTWGQETDRLSVGVITTASLTPLLVLLPVATVVLFTSEWSTRNAMWTFLLVPDRRAAIRAKLGATFAIALAVVFVVAVVSLVVASLTALLGSKTLYFGDYWGTDTGVNQALAPLLTGILVAVALGTIFRSTAVAVAAYFVATPIVQGLLSTLFGAIAPYVSLDGVNVSLATLSAGEGGWLAVLTAVTLWIVVPMCAGLILYSKREVN